MAFIYKFLDLRLFSIDFYLLVCFYWFVFIDFLFIDIFY